MVWDAMVYWYKHWPQDADSSQGVPLDGGYGRVVGSTQTLGAQLLGEAGGCVSPSRTILPQVEKNLLQFNHFRFI